jgi:hypothetical protein
MNDSKVWSKKKRKTPSSLEISAHFGVALQRHSEADFLFCVRILCAGKYPPESQTAGQNEKIVC